MSTCKQCGKEFESKRSTGKYCSSKCRKIAFRADANATLTPESNAKTGDSVPKPNESPTVTGVSEPKTGVSVENTGVIQPSNPSPSVTVTPEQVAATERAGAKYVQAAYTSGLADPPALRPGFNPAVKITPKSELKPPTFADLPADVQASIERNCAENSTAQTDIGKRAASHNRAVMTERALRYHKMFGGKPRPTGSCLTCGGPVQHPSIVKCLKCCTGASLPGAVAAVKPEPDGPLSVYSPARWAYLQGKEYVWDDDRQIAVRKDGNIGVAVPGDPGYVVEAVA